MKPLLTPFLHDMRTKAAVPFLNGDILDIGCGPADFIHNLKPGQRYVGIELEEDIVINLKRRYPEYEFFKKDIETDGLTDIKSSFDSILMIAVIEHLVNAENILRESHSLLKIDGRLVLTTPTPFGAKVHRIAAQLGLASKQAVKEHKKIYSREELSRLCGSAGFVVTGYRRFLLGMNQLMVCSRVK